jgi:hypothetical protein
VNEEEVLKRLEKDFAGKRVKSFDFMDMTEDGSKGTERFLLVKFHESDLSLCVSFPASSRIGVAQCVTVASPPGEECSLEAAAHDLAHVCEELSAELEEDHGKN